VPSPEGELDYFDVLGRAVSQAWSVRGRDATVLPDVAERALAVIEPPSGLDAAAILSWTAGARHLPKQTRPGDTFGQPPLVLYREEDFYIQALTWMEGTTAIHDHGFAGAFMVLQGSSLHVEHTLAVAERLADDQLVLGNLTVRRPEVLGPLDVRRIEPGGDFIHALFHLEQPTVSIVVRNRSCNLLLPEYGYLSPGLGWDGLWEDRTWSKRLQSIDTLVRLDPSAGRRRMEELVAGEATLWEAFSLLHHWFSRHWWDDVSATLAELLARRAAPLAILGPVLEREAGVRRILARRGLLDALHQRLFLALLANLPDAPSITTILGRLFPGQPPGALLLDWVEELASPRLRGVSGLRLTPERLAQFRAVPADRREHDLLAEVRDAWAGLPATAGATGV
jgi:hypothetical protein